MLGASLQLFSIRGIAVRAHASWLVIVALVGWSFWGRFVVWYDRPTGTAVVMAVVGAVLFFGSVLAHEIAHALEAQHRGLHVGGITLFLFGGATETRFDVKRPVDEFALTAVGPWTSIVLAAGFGLATVAADDAGAGAVAEVTGTIGWLNLALGLFNLLPGAPLDGGRLLRAGVWKLTGDRRRAIVVAADAGRILGLVLVGLGVLQLVTVGGLVGGIWLALIGWFLHRAASAERFQVEIEELVGDRRAEAFVDHTEPIPAQTTVAAAIERWFGRSDAEVHTVADGSGIVGVVDVAAVASVAEPVRDRVPTVSVVRPIGELPHVDADAPATDLLDVLPGNDVVVVTGPSGPEGVVTAVRMRNALDRLQRMAAVQARARADREPVATAPGGEER